MKKVWNALQKENSMLVCDFDGTLTTSGSSMHGMVYILGKDTPFARDRDRLYRQYGRDPKASERTIGRGESDLLWWREQMELFIRYRIREEHFSKVAEILPVRTEAAELLKRCQSAGIPVWIVSSGIANVIEAWLERQAILAEGTRILANRVYFQEGTAFHYEGEMVPCGKIGHFLDAVRPRPDQHLIFLGDQTEDLCLDTKNAENFLVDKSTGVVTFVPNYVML